MQVKSQNKCEKQDILFEEYNTIHDGKENFDLHVDVTGIYERFSFLLYR